MNYHVTAPDGIHNFTKDELIVWYRQEFPWCDEADIYRLTLLEDGQSKYFSRGITVSAQATVVLDSSCKHANSYVNYLTKNLSFRFCRDCKEEVK